MDGGSCVECGSATVGLVSSLDLPSGAMTRRWSECGGCGWESTYVDVVSRR